MLAIPPDVRAAADPISHSPPDRRPFARFAPRDPLLRINELRTLILLELHLKMTLHHHLAQAGSEQSGVGICHWGAHTHDMQLAGRPTSGGQATPPQPLSVHSNNP